MAILTFTPICFSYGLLGCLFLNKRYREGLREWRAVVAVTSINLDLGGPRSTVSTLPSSVSLFKHCSFATTLIFGRRQVRSSTVLLRPPKRPSGLHCSRIHLYPQSLTTSPKFSVFIRAQNVGPRVGPPPTVRTVLYVLQDLVQLECHSWTEHYICLVSTLKNRLSTLEHSDPTSETLKFLHVCLYLLLEVSSWCPGQTNFVQAD